MAATNAQVQHFSDERIRLRCEQIRSLYLAIKDDIAAIDDVYANLTNSPTWSDSRSDAPPHLLTPNDILAVNSFIHMLVTAIEGDANYSKVLQGCVRSVTG